MAEVHTRFFELMVAVQNTQLPRSVVSKEADYFDLSYDLLFFNLRNST